MIDLFMKYMKTRIVLVVLGFTVLLFTLTGAYFFLTRTQTGEKVLCSIHKKFCDNDSDPIVKGDDDTPTENPTEKPIDKPNIPTNYPIALPTDMPFTVEEMKQLAEKGRERFYISYNWDRTKSNWSEEQFAEYIEPYLVVYLASMEYSFEKYGDVFMGKNPSLEDRTNLRLTVVEKCTDVSVAYTEEVCTDVKMIGTVSPFTYGVSFYVNTSHEDFSSEFIIDVGMHETIHLLQYTYDDGYAASTIPTWYKESMAVGLAYNSPVKNALYKKDFDVYGLPESVEQLNEWYNLPGDTLENLGKKRSAYYVGGMFFNFLMESAELEEYLKIMPKQYSVWEDRNEFEKAFESTFDGKGTEEMYQEFFETIN